MMRKTTPTVPTVPAFRLVAERIVTAIDVTTVQGAISVQSALPPSSLTPPVIGVAARDAPHAGVPVTGPSAVAEAVAVQTPQRRMNNPYTTASAPPGKKAMHAAAFTELPDASGVVHTITLRFNLPHSPFAASGIHPVAFGLPGVGFVPYHAVAEFQPQHARADAKPAGAVKIIIGQLAQGVPPAFVKTMIWMASGCRVYDVSVHFKAPGMRSDGRRAERSYSAYAFAWVAPGDFRAVVSAVHKRVLLDRRGWLVAATAEGIDGLDRYCDMLAQKCNDTCHLQCAPYKCVTVCRAGGQSNTDNQYHPLCGCHWCADIAAAATTPQSVSAFVARRRELMASTPPDQVAWWLPHPQFIEETLQAVRNNACFLWPQWQTAPRWHCPRDDAGRVNGAVVAHRPLCDRAAAAFVRP
jgi:hypothetical protein